MKTKLMIPPVNGWLQGTLNDSEVALVWDCINRNEGDSNKQNLVGQVGTSNLLHDEDNLIWKEMILPLLKVYGQHFSHKWSRMPLIYPEDENNGAEPFLENLWVNYQKAGEYQPIHNHSGLYSFVIWLKEAVEHDDQIDMPNSKGASKPFNNSFIFNFIDTLGEVKTHKYPLGKKWENTILFFPATLHHTVFPFFESDETRISVSGNVALRLYHNEIEQRN